MKKGMISFLTFLRKHMAKKGFCPETYMALSFMVDKSYPRRPTTDKQKILDYARKAYSGSKWWNEEVFNRCWNEYRRYLESI